MGDQQTNGGKKTKQYKRNSKHCQLPNKRLGEEKTAAVATKTTTMHSEQQ